jgi:filamentous hemagglutinin family protein
MKTEKIFLKIALCIIFWLLAAVSAHAGTGHGLAADGSLGTQVDKVEQIHNITGGATAGNNLFHSFSDFNVETGETANFIGNQSLANIISRVTGGNDSRIDGLLKTTDTSANLYLMNPNGVMFGPNAALDIQGSFHVTTADYLKFEDGKELHADLGNKSVLSAAPVEAFGFLGDSAGSITLNGTRLEVSEGKTLSLIGQLATESKSITNADLKASGGCVNLASVKSAGEVKLTETGIEATSEQLGNIELEHSSINVSNTANSSSVGQVFVQANDFVLKGSIIVDNYSEQDAAEPSLKIETDNLTVKDGSVISADTFGQGKSGDVSLNAGNNLTLTNGSVISASTVGHGNSGDVSLNAGNNLTLKNDSFILAITIGQGNSGDVSLNAANNLTLTDGSFILANTGVGSSGDVLLYAAESVIFGHYGGDISIITAAHESTGDAGKVIINANNILLSNGAYMNTTTYGSGRGGDMLLNAKKNVEFSGDGHGFIKAASCSTGDAGNIEINADNILFADGVELDSATYGKGKGGTVNLNANEKVSVDGRDGRNGRSTKLQVSSGGTGDAGSLVINAKKIEVSNSAYIDSATTYKREVGGKGGTVELNAVNIEFNNGAWLYSETTSQGQGGTLILNADERVLFCDSVIQATSKYAGEGAGDGGSVLIRAANIELADGALINAGTSDQGNAGKIMLAASKVISLTEKGHWSGEEFSTIASGTDADSTGGQGGYIGLNAPEIILTNGAIISAGTEYTGEVTFEGDEGCGGTIGIIADSLILQDESEITASSSGTGSGGSVLIGDYALIESCNEQHKTAEDPTGPFGDFLDTVQENGITETKKILADNSGIELSTQGSGNAGVLKIKAENIEFTGGAYINSTTYGSGQGGKVVIDVAETMSLSGENNAQKGSNIKVASGCSVKDAADKGYDIGEFTGDAGSLYISAKNIEVTDGAWLNSSTYGDGKGGNVTLDLAENVLFKGQRSNKEGSKIQVATYNGSGNAGTLEIKAKQIRFKDYGYINSATDEGTGNAGKIMLVADELISLDGLGYNYYGGDKPVATFSSSAYAKSRGGRGGYIGFNAPEIILTNGAIISAGTEYTGEVTPEGDEGCGGTIGIIADSLILRNGSEITGTTSGTGAGGSVLIGDYALIESCNEQHKTAEDPTGPFGDFLDRIQENGVTRTQNLLLANGSAISASSTSDAENAGESGDLIIRATDSIDLNYNSNFKTESKNAGGGSINIQTKNRLWLLNSWITTSTESTNENEKGGNITIDPTFVILQNVNPCTVGINNSRIEANANFGAGGNISIVTDYLIQSPDSTIEASSNKSVDGEVNIQSLDFDVSGVLANLNVNLLDAGKWQKTPCRLRSGASVSRLILKGRDAVPTAHDDFLSGLPAILSDPDFFAEDDNPYREGYVSPDVFEKGEEEEREEEKREEKECYN